MAIKTHDEILATIKEKFSDDTSDETLEFLEDVTDTFNDYENKLNDSTDWKAKYEENDKEWRQKYKDRFFEGGNSDEDDNTNLNDPPAEPPKPKTFDDLFKIGE